MFHQFQDLQQLITRTLCFSVCRPRTPPLLLFADMKRVHPSRNSKLVSSNSSSYDDFIGERAFCLIFYHEFYHGREVQMHIRIFTNNDFLMEGSI